MKVEELGLSLAADNMHGLFIFPSSTFLDPTRVYNFVPVAGCQPLDMFDLIKMIDLELVKKWSEYLSAAREEYLIENLLWSGTRSN